MAWEFPAVSQSRIEFWKQPQYTRKGMLVFTILFGFFGLHHFMLRSPQTGLLFFLANILSLGYCWFYDIIQLATTDVKELNKYGMSLPWGAAGIAKGMWKCGSGEDQNGGASEENKKEEKEPHNPTWFFLYALLIPLAPLSKLASGDTANAMTGFLNLTIMPFGWYIYVLTALYEYFKLFFKPADVFIFDVDRAFPFTMLGWDKEGRSSRMRLTPLPDDHCEDCDGIFVRMYKIFIRALMPMLPILLPILRLLLPPQVIAAMQASGLAVEQGAKTAEEGLAAAEITFQKAKNVAEVVGEQAKDIAMEVGTQTKTILESSGKVAKRMSNLATQIPQVSTAAFAKASVLAEHPSSITSTLGKLSSNTAQQGGGLNINGLQDLMKKEPTSYFDYAIFGTIAAVLGGGFLLHTGRTFADVIHQSSGPNDAPPY